MRPQRGEHHARLAADVDWIEQHLYRIDLGGVVMRDLKMNDGPSTESRLADRSHTDRHLAGDLRQHRTMRGRAHHQLLCTGAYIQFGFGNGTGDRYRQRLIRNAHTLIPLAHNINRHQRRSVVRAASDGCPCAWCASSLATSFRFRRSDELSGSAPDIFAINTAASSISWPVKTLVAASC